MRASSCAVRGGHMHLCLKPRGARSHTQDLQNQGSALGATRAHWITGVHFAWALWPMPVWVWRHAQFVLGLFESHTAAVHPLRDHRRRCCCCLHCACALHCTTPYTAHGVPHYFLHQQLHHVTTGAWRLPGVRVPASRTCFVDGLPHGGVSSMGTALQPNTRLRPFPLLRASLHVGAQ